jgi:protein-tyrosine kinase
MSRIHEALKKAALEGYPAAESANVAPAVSIAKTDPTATDRSLRFEDIAASCAHPDWNPDPKVNAFNPELSPHCAEQLRILRSRLYQLRAKKPFRSVLITSAVSGEGKTFVASNLARAIARQADCRILLIDADLRRSHLHVPLGAPSKPGLSDYLRGTVDEMAVIQSGIESNLCFIPGGEPVSNPSELLSNGLLKRLLNRITPAFDWIIIDSPPCLPIADAGILAELCDGLLFVVRANSTPAKVVRNACQKLVEKHIVGVVLNAVEEEALNYASYYGDYTRAYRDDAESQLLTQ